MDFLKTVGETALKNLSTKLADGINAAKGRLDDDTLGKTIQEMVLDKYGNEPFYNDLDEFLSHREVINHLIASLREPSSNIYLSESEFIDENWNMLLADKPKCLSCSTQIKDALGLIHKMHCL